MAPEEDELLNRLQKGDVDAVADGFSQHHDRLWKLISFRLSPRLGGRVDADDVLQEAYLAAVERLQHLAANRPTSVFIWLRLIVVQTVTDLHRRHLGAQMRDAYREISLQGIPAGHSTSASLAAHVMGNFTSPSRAAMREETAARLEAALDSMNPIDREVLALRHFEELTNQEAAEVLGIEEKAASIRYIRALKRLKEILSATSGFQEGAP
jgi:RNA polymerase sigma-70 factor (ECF subfamily)